MIHRRSFIACASALAFAGCAQGSGGNVNIPQTVLNDVNLALGGLMVVVPEIEKDLPNLLTAEQASIVMDYVTKAQSLLNQIATNMQSPEVASEIQQVEVDFNAALNVLDSIPLIPPPYSTIIHAASVVAPELEQMLNTQFGFQMTRARQLLARHSGPQMSLPAARTVLQSTVQRRSAR